MNGRSSARSNFLRSRPWLLWAGLAGVAMAGFALTASGLAGSGFPLDDAWIHQSYARNLALRAEWSIVPGQVSSGSTAPLWSALLAPGHLLGLAPTLWSGLLGYAMLLALAGVGARALIPRGGTGAWGLGLGLLLILEWHLVWAASSGMETLAAGLIALEVNRRLLTSEPNPLAVGALIGAGVWLRPDLLTLALPAAIVWGLRRRHAPGAWNWLKRIALAAAALIVPYLWLQTRLSNEIWPSTFFAKQAEYAELRAAPYLQRLYDQVRPLLAGTLAVLAPGVIVWIVNGLRGRRWAEFAPLAWAVGYLALFAARLPVNYQHGRYAMPTLPVLMWLGMAGMRMAWAWLSSGRLQWVVGRVWIGTVAVATAIFLFLGARVFARDVAIIETEMVQTSRWIAANTEPDALVAAHDIGALGYYGDRAILDLAGLISPEVIPILRDEAALAARLDQAGADYLMTFPGWYPQLTSQATLVYQTNGPFSPGAGGENMAVYRP